MSLCFGFNRNHFLNTMTKIKYNWNLLSPSDTLGICNPTIFFISQNCLGIRGLWPCSFKNSYCEFLSNALVEPLNFYLPPLHWASVLCSRSQVAQYRPRGPRGPSGPFLSLSAWTLEVWAILSHSLCPSLCPSSSSSLPASARRRHRSAAPTPRTGTLLCPTWTASSLKHRRPQVGNCLWWLLSRCFLCSCEVSVSYLSISLVCHLITPLQPGFT